MIISTNHKSHLCKIITITQKLTEGFSSIGLVVAQGVIVEVTGCIHIAQREDRRG